MDVRARKCAQRVGAAGMLVAGVLVALVDVLAREPARVSVAVVAPAPGVGRKEGRASAGAQAGSMGRQDGGAARRLASYELALSPRNVHVAAWIVPQPPLLLAQ